MSPKRALQLPVRPLRDDQEPRPRDSTPDDGPGLRGAPLRTSGRRSWRGLTAQHGQDQPGLVLVQAFQEHLALTASAIPLALGLVLAAPAAWGAGGALEPRTLPPGWVGAAKVVADEPGTTLVLPWHLYYTASFADGRNILNPGPDVLGGDTISSYDPEIGGGQEQLDTRPREAADVLEGYRQGKAGAERLAALGVRWVFVPLEYDWSVSGRALADDPGLRPVEVGDGARLYEVRDWPGEIRTPDGSRGDVDGLVAPLRTAPSQGGTWAFPGTSGWLRGFDRVPVTSTGLLAVPPGDGPLWYWPAALITLGNLVTISATAFAAWPLVRARRRAGRSSSPSGA